MLVQSTVNTVQVDCELTIAPALAGHYALFGGSIDFTIPLREATELSSPNLARRVGSLDQRLLTQLTSRVLRRFQPAACGVEC